MFTEQIIIKDSTLDVVYMPSIWTPLVSQEIINTLIDTVSWRQETWKMGAREGNVPRLTAWYGDQHAEYTYAKIKNSPLPWTPVLLSIKKEVEKATGATYNSVLINYYRDGNDSISWHADNEPELEDTIASVSFGAERKFHLKAAPSEQYRKKLNELFDLTYFKKKKFSVLLGTGSIILMQGNTQRYWQHCINKTTKVIQPRVNLTFRTIKTKSVGAT